MKIFLKLKLFILTILPIILLIAPISIAEKNPIRCLSVTFLNKECIGCGMTRACLNAIHFNFEKAFEYNRLVIIVLPLCIICYIDYYIKTLRQIIDSTH